MNRRIVFGICLAAICSAVWLGSCKKDKYVNPYDDPAYDAPDENPDPDNLTSDNFAWLQHKVFTPTCANSGCHDGTFPPDFRSINSSYNTLVYRTPVKTVLSDDFNYNFKYRVWPYHADSSVIYQRLIYHKDTFAERMPLEASGDPFPYWWPNKDTYILAIKNWINAGAKDMFGNYPTMGNNQPQITGLLGFNSGSTSGAFTRGGGNTAPLQVPSGNIDIWFLVSDDSTALSNISYLKCTVSSEMYDTAGATILPITYDANGPTGEDFTGTGGQKFTHYVTINTSGNISGDYLYLRAYLDDGSQGAPIEIPNSGAGVKMMAYFALKIQ